VSGASNEATRGRFAEIKAKFNSDPGSITIDDVRWLIIEAAYMDDAHEENDALQAEVERLRAEVGRLTRQIIDGYQPERTALLDEVERLRVERTVLDAARVQDVEIRNRVDALVERLGQSEWIVCAEVLRYLGLAALTDGTEAPNAR